MLAEASHTFAQAGFDYQALLQLVASNVVEVLCDLCLIRLPSEDGQRLPPVAKGG